MNDSIIAKKALDVLKSTDKGKESRTYTITSRNPELLDKLEAALAFISYCSGVGHSTEFKIFVDGDGASDIQVEGIKWDSEKYPVDVNADGDIESIGLD